MNDITPKEAIANLNHLYGIVSPDIQRSLDVAIKALEEHPSGDCISREALKDEVRKHAEYYADRTEEDRYNVGYTECACEVLDFIDNAQAVEITEEQAIANGTPYNQSGDCISREALKETINSNIVQATKVGIIADADYLWSLLNYAIDDAPTVDIKDQIAGAYNEGYMCGSKEAEKARTNEQKTKWVKIFENPFTNGYVCPFCGHKIQVTEQFLPQVTECESCGADMRKGGAE